MTHIWVGKLTIIDSDNGLSPGRRHAIIWTNVGILLIGPLGTNLNEILIGIQTFSFKKMQLKMSSAKWHPFCLGLNVLTLLMPKTDYSQITRLIAWLLMPWLLASPGHQQPCYWLQDRWIFIFHEEGFQLPLPSKCCEMVITQGQFWHLGIVVACVSLLVRGSVCVCGDHVLVCATIRHLFKLGSPKLDQRYKKNHGLDQYPFMGLLIDLELKSPNLPHFEIVQVINHHLFKYSM